MFYAEEPDKSIGSNFNATPRNNSDMRSDVCLLLTTFFLTQSKGKRALDNLQVHRVCDRFVEKKHIFSEQLFKLLSDKHMLHETDGY